MRDYMMQYACADMRTCRYKLKICVKFYWLIWYIMIYTIYIILHAIIYFLYLCNIFIKSCATPVFLYYYLI